MALTPPLATFEFSSGSWTQGGGAIVSSGQLFVLHTESVNLTGTGAFLSVQAGVGCGSFGEGLPLP